MNLLTNDLEVLAGLHERGDLTDEEFSQAKAALLGAVRFHPDKSGSDLGEVVRWDKRAQLDREWLLEREKYISRCKHGSDSQPDKTASVGMGIFIAIFGGIWTVSAARAGAPFVFPLFGIVFIILGIVGSIKGYEQAEQYDAARKRYEHSRTTLTQENTHATPQSRDI